MKRTRKLVSKMALPDMKARLIALRPKLAKAAQNAYDNFQPKDEVSLGACGDIAEALVAVLKAEGLDAALQSAFDEENEITHYVAGVDRYSVDLPWYEYEDYIGHSQIFTVRSGVVITPEMIKVDLA